MLLGVFFTALYFASTVGICNSQDGPDYALTRAIVEHRTTEIGAYPTYINPDFALIDGHAYAKRSPGDSLLGVPFYMLALLFRGLATSPYGGQHPGIDASSPTEALAMLFPALCGAGTIVLLYLICLRLTSSRAAAVLTALAAGLGTLIWRYSITYQRVPVYLFLLTLIFYLATVYRPTGGRWRSTALIGAAIGFLVAVDSTAVVAVPLFLAFFLWSIVRGTAGDTRTRLLVSLLAGCAAGASVLFVFNLVTFHALYVNLYQASPSTPWQSFGVLFSTPLWPGIWINLFNNGHIPLDAISPVLRSHPVWFAHEGANWALQSHYRGIFVQSPYLIAAVPGFALVPRRYRIFAVLALALALGVLIMMSRFMDFFAATLFDTRYFMAMIPFLSIGLAFWWAFVLGIRTPFLKALAVAITGALCLVSVYWGWRADLENFGPHISGDHRFLLDIPPRDWLSTSDGLHKIGLLFINTFPNIENLYMLGIYAALGVAGVTGARRIRRALPPSTT